MLAASSEGGSDAHARRRRVSFPTISIIDPDQARPPNWPSRRPSARTGGLIIACEDRDAAARAKARSHKNLAGDHKTFPSRRC